MLHIYNRLQRKLFMYIFLLLNNWIYFNDKSNNKIIPKYYSSLFYLYMIIYDYIYLLYNFLDKNIV